MALTLHHIAIYGSNTHKTNPLPSGLKQVVVASYSNVLIEYTAVVIIESKLFSKLSCSQSFA